MPPDAPPLLPADPDLEPGSAAFDALATALREPSNRTVLPTIEGLDSEVLVRWLYRGWLDRQARWRPLIHIDTRHLPPGDLAVTMADALEVARGGWLSLGPGIEGRVDTIALATTCQSAGTRLILASEARIRLPSAAVQRVLWLDRLHLAATDPTLAPARLALLASCRAGGHVLLRGPPGAGKRLLVRWAHATLDDGPLQVVSAGTNTRVEAGQWQLYEEIERLGADQLEALTRTADTEAEYWREPPPARGEAVRRPRHAAFADIVGESPALAIVLDRALRYAPSALPVLVRGPTGSGKESLARAVHVASGRTGRYMAIDLAAQSETLVESALFGHVRGAFTGADRERPGAFREARGGTLFLDELGNLSPTIQVKLLRALEARAVQPVGSDQVHTIDVRVVAATNADLEDMVRRGEFREDLLYRFNPSATLWVPPLRERREDILSLATRFLADARGGAPSDIDAAARAVLLAWPWPGNVRELRHVMDAAAVESAGGVVRARHLGVLAPSRHRNAPAIVTTNDPEGPDASEWRIRSSVRQRLMAVTIRVPGFAERGALGARSAVLASLGGRPIRPDALDALAHRSWRGNGTELARVMRAVRDQGDGPVDRSLLLSILPDLLASESAAPIIALLFPTALPGGRVGGFKQVFLEGEVLVGRVHRLAQLEPAAGSPARVVARWSALRAALRSEVPGFLCIDHLPQVSRAQALVAHEGGELIVNGLPGTSLPAWAGPLGTAALHPAEPGQPVSLGSAGVIELRAPGVGALLRIYLFAGEVALAEHAELVLRAPEPAATFFGAEAAVGTPGRVWILDRAERVALNDMLCEYVRRGGAFAQHIRTRAESMRRDRLTTLGTYLESAHPSQSCVRIYAHEPNQALRDELREALQALDEPHPAWERLPKGIRECVLAP